MITYGSATLEDVRLILDWAADEGWNPGVEDADAFFATDPEGFFVARLDGLPIASISVVNHSDTFAFLGLYIVRPEHRGRGIGFRLWEHALAHAGDRVIGLDGVAEQQANYAKSGFTTAGSTARFTGHVPQMDRGEMLPFATAADIDRAIDWEADVTGFRKETFLRGWLRASENRTTLIANGGFCTVRTCRDGVKVGPLLARHHDTALDLIAAAAKFTQCPLTIDVPVSSTQLRELCIGLGLKSSFETARMYLGTAKPIEAEYYAVSTLELG
ncbi:MAG: GNAT family N-acetyltransferase [Pseudomonadota bacterium]